MRLIHFRRKKTLDVVGRQHFLLNEIKNSWGYKWKREKAEGHGDCVRDSGCVWWLGDL